MDSKVSGTPMWLFRFPLVAVTMNFLERTWAISSLVVVFPLLPVRARIGMPRYFLWNVARSWSV